ncbi:MAG: RNA polymerase sigma factor region1.1 domain-containing protein [Pirellulaceae bacterium]
MDLDLRQLIATGREQGYLTYQQVGKYLPDEDNSSEKLDNLLVMLDKKGIALVDKAPVAPFIQGHHSCRRKRTFSADEVEEGHSDEFDSDDEKLPSSFGTQAEMPKLSDDPIRLYLSQMSQIPLFTRDEEIALAKKIEITRKRFRRSLLGNDFALRQTVEILKRVHKGQLPFDRTIKVSLTERLTKEQIERADAHQLG